MKKSANIVTFFLNGCRERMVKMLRFGVVPLLSHGELEFFGRELGPRVL